jgi:hypothetical protein
VIWCQNAICGLVMTVHCSNCAPVQWLTNRRYSPCRPSSVQLDSWLVDQLRHTGFVLSPEAGTFGENGYALAQRSQRPMLVSKQAS